MSFSDGAEVKSNLYMEEFTMILTATAVAAAATFTTSEAIGLGFGGAALGTLAGYFIKKIYITWKSVALCKKMDVSFTSLKRKKKTNIGTSRKTSFLATKISFPYFNTPCDLGTQIPHKPAPVLRSYNSHQTNKKNNKPSPFIYKKIRYNVH